jgi:hypothetical protein
MTRPVIPEQPTIELLDRAADTPAESFRVVTATHPFSFERKELSLPEGATVAEIVAAAKIPHGCMARVTINGVPVTDEWWPRVRPRKGAVVLVRAVPLGGGGGQGQDQNKTLRTVLQVVVAIVAIVLIVLSYGAATPAVASLYLAAASAVSLVGSINVARLLPPPSCATRTPRQVAA